jgi:hypothetical protein
MPAYLHAIWWRNPQCADCESCRAHSKLLAQLTVKYATYWSDMPYGLRVYQAAFTSVHRHVKRWWPLTNELPATSASIAWKITRSVCWDTLHYYFIMGARVGAVGWGTALQAGRSRVCFPMGSLVLGSAQPLTELSISFRGSKGSRCVGLTTLLTTI